ncbi:S41 family peptidase [Fulvivirga sedimenti]|uniref:Tricorn protease homolog n=1 Tax=Fulvivirga sedimenti TaxID=2879465 RepID=A0A9X1HRL0_9BACT|nr:S41 family peptidase [Fulvivirga sedimenti]MCA6074733.1 PDZ domain-containing protein [Fulvivirga sedimenti]MCA6075910.1 PDZ domain-containing protein [Fulvivirga sedimenti]MCA6077038.1 PDZ domain-containing protein [Fulvivirga sedimenti]
MRTLFTLLFLISILPVNGQGTQLLREPTLSANSIVFVYADDLWKVSRAGGDAVRLTSHEGSESLPHFSPDEKWIAFSAEYDGNTDVYVIPSEGGTPLRLTWHPGGDFVQGWTPDGEVMFRSGRVGHPTQTSTFFKVNRKGGMPEPVGLPRAAFGEMSPDGKHIAYVPITFWDPEWRNYRGGQAMPIWIVDMETMDLIRTPQPTQERHLDPVWYNGSVYYLSERDYASNIWSFNPATKAEAQITFHKQFDVKSLDAGPNGIVYEQGGYLHLLDPANGNTQQLVINVRGDMNFSRPRWESVSAGDLNNPAISPTGKRAIFEVRGEIFTFPKEEGTWRNLTNSPGVADRAPVWSPKGDKVAWFSDKSGEYALMVADQDGGNVREIKMPDPTFYFQPDWSPDGKYIAFTDTDYNIWIVDLQSGTMKIADTDRYAHPNRAMNPVWSPDSKWIAYSRQLESHFKAIFVYNVSTGARHQLTDGMADAITPVWDESGAYLYTLASTNYGLQSGWLDMSSYDPSVTRSLYCIVLAKDGKAPALPRSDEETVSEEPQKKPEEKSKKKTDEPAPEEKGVNVVIDVDGIQQRIVPLELPDRNYAGLVAGPEHVVFVAESVPNTPGLTIHRYDVKKQKAEDYQSGVQSGVVSADRKQMLIRKGNAWSIIPTTGKADNGTLKMDARIRVDPQQEYHQIFREGWRYMRDFLYVNNVHGAPWDKIYAWYSPWIDHVRHRSDLNYVVDIMSGEVSIGHSYVRGGDMPDTEFVPVGLLGCDFAVVDGYYRIAKIYDGETWNPNLTAPLGVPGIGVKEGDYLLAVNGIELRAPMNPYSLFEQTAGRAVTITTNSNPAMNGARESLVVPVANESMLRGMDWVEGNRRKVDELSGGKLAYVYVPNTSGPGFTYFNRYYFAQQDKKGAVIDERNNGGGSAADYMIDVMNRKLFGFFNSKANDNRPWTTPMAGIWGPKVMIINERAGSGGDLLPYMFKEAEIGPLVGTRTWGGLVGTWDTPLFIDGGRMVAPRGGFYDADGKWAVEGVGVSPDIEVIQDPKRILEGHDPQLEKAVEEALRLLENNEFQLKPEPPAPVKWRRPEGMKE